MRQISRLRNEDGAVLIVSLMMLVLLTLLGISVSTTSDVELQIAGNEMDYKRNMYRAEAAVMDCAQIMDETAEIDLSTAGDWIIPFAEGQALESTGAVRDDDFWDEGVDTDNITPGTADAVLDPNGNARYIAIFAGLPPGEDFDSELREFILYGRYFNPNRPDLGRSIIRIGYRRSGGIAE